MWGKFKTLNPAQPGHTPVYSVGRVAFLSSRDATAHQRELLSLSGRLILIEVKQIKRGR